MKNYHYVYKIINNNPTDERKYYIGVRTAKGCTPNEDTKYWGSSKYLKAAIDEIGLENFSKEILSTWETRKEAISEEIRLHEELDIVKNKEYYNKSKSKSTGFSCVTVENHFTTKMSEEEKIEHYRKLSEINKIKYQEQMERQGGHWSKLIDEKVKTEIYSKAGKTQSKTKSTPKFKEKISKIFKEAFIGRNQNSSKNPNAKTIEIYDSEDNLQFVSNGNFDEICKLNNLPRQALVKSYKNDSARLYQNIDNSSIGRLKKRNYYQYKGWYAIKL